MSTRRRSSPTPAAALVTAVLVVFTGLGALYLAARAPRAVPGQDYVRVDVEFGDLADLDESNDVRVAGHRVGRVLDPRIEDGRAVATLRLDGDVVVRESARVVVRSQGLLGQRYVELVPGGSGTRLPDGARLPRTASSATVRLPEVLSAFDQPRRRHLRALIDRLGAGTLGRGRELNLALAQAPALLTDLRQVSVTALARRDAVERFLPSLERALSALGAAREDLAAGWAPGADALQPFADRAGAVRRALDAGARAFPATRSGLRHTDDLLSALEGLARTAASALAPAPLGLRRTASALESAPRPLDSASQLLESLGRARGDLVRLSARATPELPRVRAALAEPLPLLEEINRRPCDVLGWARNWRSMLGAGAPGGGAVGPLNVLRIEFIASAESLGGLAGNPAAAPRTNAYPAPCLAGKEAVR